MQSSERGGLFLEAERAISRGCPSSPIFGAFFPEELQERLESTGLFFVRTTDDVVVQAPTRWTLRAAVNSVNEGLNGPCLETATEKTLIGRVERGSDFLGYRVSP